jgi:hypothetical protein
MLLGEGRCWFTEKTKTTEALLEIGRELLLTCLLKGLSYFLSPYAYGIIFPAIGKVGARGLLGH